MSSRSRRSSISTAAPGSTFSRLPTTSSGRAIRCGGTCPAVVASTYDAYLEAIEVEAERASPRFGLLVIPGLELTYDDADPRLGAHALALGLRRFVGLDRGLEAALGEARAEGAALVAAHP